jgi:hypothetical protein
LPLLILLALAGHGEGPNAKVNIRPNGANHRVQFCRGAVPRDKLLGSAPVLV